MKTTILKISMLFLLFSLMGAGCEKEEEPDVKNTDGLVLYYGDPAVDGCGWIIKVNNIEYSPINLDAKFHEDGLKVTLDYDTLTTTWNCGWRELGYQQIKIMAIGLKK